VIPAPTAYARAEDLEHALELLAQPEAKAIAGGQSLVPVMKLRIVRPALVVDLERLPLRGIDDDERDVRIGALTTWDDLATDPAFQGPELAALGECALGIGDLQVRNRGTIGGGLAHGDPASDMAAVLLALDATVVLRSADGERTLPVADFLLGPFTTALDPAELITSVVVPKPPAGSGSAYASVEHPASGFPLAGAAALVSGGGGVRLAVTGVADRPFLVGSETDPALDAVETFDDRFATPEYRRHLVRVVCERALEKARGRAAEAGS
jgi:carbon-monoxide dehydrogenase medium subunit